jgi:hypothetical protein
MSRARQVPALPPSRRQRLEKLSSGVQRDSEQFANTVAVFGVRTGPYRGSANRRIGTNDQRRRAGMNQHVVPAMRANLPRWPILAALGVPLALIIMAASPLGYNFFYVVIVVPGVLLLWAVSGVYAAVLCVRAALKRAWRQSLAASVMPLLLLAIALDYQGFIVTCRYVGNVLHFIAKRPDYDAYVGSLPSIRKPRLAEFDWDGMPWVTWAVVYDESDQVTSPPERRSVDWLDQASQHLSCEGFGVVQRFWAHYYLVSFPC